MRNLHFHSIVLIFVSFCFPASAQVIWQNYGSSLKHEEGRSLCEDDNGNLYLLINGDTSSTTGSEWAIMKLDSMGDPQWKKYYGSNDNDRASEIVFHANSLFIAGERRNDSVTQGSLHRLDTSGNLLLQHYFYHPDSTVSFRDLIVLGDGNLALLAQVRSTPTGLAGGAVYKVDSAGNLFWSSWFEPSQELVAQGIAELPNGKLVITGDYKQALRFDLLVYQLDQNGQFVKQQLVSNGFTRGGNGIDLDANGNIAIGGEGASATSLSFDVTLSLLDSNLNLISDVYVLPGVAKNDAAFGMCATSKGTYLFTGYRIEPENGETEMTVLESNAAGQILHAYSFRSSASCIGANIKELKSDKLAAIGSDFNQAPGVILARGEIEGLSLDELKTEKSQPPFPNPLSGQILRFAAPQNNKDWQLFNPWGSAISIRWIDAYQLQVPADLAKGFYFLQNHQGQRFKIIRN